MNTHEVMAVLGHRGPDSAGSEVLNFGGSTLFFGHTRLAINDLSEAGAQPMFSHDRRWLLVFNGEIYNHKDIRRMLRVNFRGHSDSETLVEALSCWGFKKTLSKLNGIFAFAAVDLDEQLCFLARDPFGVKPLYYSFDNSSLCFGSEIRAIKALGKSSYIDSTALSSFLALRYTPSPATLFGGVFRVPPGCAVEYSLKTSRVTKYKYIEPNYNQFAGTLDEATECYEDKLRQAVRRQMLSDVPLGIFLSGGVDSALVAALARESADDLTAFTVGFGDGYQECEIALAAETAKTLDIKHRIVQIGEEASWEAFTGAISHVEEPLATTSILPMWYLARAASSHVKAVLTGQGSDEPWGGYRRYKGVLLADLLSCSTTLKSMSQYLLRAAGNHEVAERFLRALSSRDESSLFMETYALFSQQERVALAGTASDGDAHIRIEDWLSWYDPESSRSSVERMMGIDTRMNLSDDLLLYGDKISMAHSLEARVPILDLEVVSFIESLPLRYRVSLFNNKIIHKRTAGNYLPSAIVNRRKLGFRVPVAEWLRNQWYEKARDLFLGGGKIGDLVDITVCSSMLEQHRKGSVNHERKLFALLGLGIWADQHL